MNDRKINNVTVESLNGVEKYDNEYLDSFHGSRSMYTHLQLKDTRFLEEHGRKGY